jgi:hypothetical protein
MGIKRLQRKGFRGIEFDFKSKKDEVTPIISI